MTTGTDTMHFISATELPAGCKPTYLSTNPTKPRNIASASPVAATKLIILARSAPKPPTSPPPSYSSTASSPLRVLTSDRFEYMWIPTRDIPTDIMDQYKLATLVRNDIVLVEIRKGMYGLSQAGIIANSRLKAHLATWGYRPCPNTPGRFLHDTHPVVDDFGIKYVGHEHADHLIQCLQSIYEITTDWSGTKYCGLTLDWDYQAHTVHLSMPG
jgi:hypothetical protein